MSAFEQVDRVRAGADNLTGEPVFETTWTGRMRRPESTAEWVAMQVALLGSVARGCLPAVPWPGCWSAARTPT